MSNRNPQYSTVAELREEAKRRMEELGWNREALATISGVSMGTVTRFFVGRDRIRPNFVRAIMKALGLELGATVEAYERVAEIGARRTLRLDGLGRRAHIGYFAHKADEQAVSFG